jgi:hypothetical protein
MRGRRAKCSTPRIIAVGPFAQTVLGTCILTCAMLWDHADCSDIDPVV